MKINNKHMVSRRKWEMGAKGVFVFLTGRIIRIKSCIWYFESVTPNQNSWFRFKGSSSH